MSKKNEGKPMMSLMSANTIAYVTKVREYGIKKYGMADDWKTTERKLHYDAALRHIYAEFEGEINDSESGLPHLAHAICNLMFLIEADIENGELDKLIGNPIPHTDNRKSSK